MDLRYIVKEANYYRKLNGLSRAFKKFLLTQTPLKNLVNTPLYNKFYSIIVRKRARKMSPYILQIENTNICNARCVMCPHTIMKRKGKIMKLNEFKKIFDNVLKNYNIKRMAITGFGEPFIDKDLINKIKYVNEKFPEIKIELYTNAYLLDKKIADELLGLNLSKITFSINGTEKNYKKIMGLDYNRTKDNVSYFLKKKRELKHPILTNVSLMILKENEEDIKNFIEFWSPISDSVRVYAPSDWAGALKNIQKRGDFKGKRWPCAGLWNTIMIDVDGNVIMCCRDYESRVKFGNALKEDVKKIRESKKFQDLLKDQLEMRYSTPVCLNCDNSFDSSMDWIC